MKYRLLSEREKIIVGDEFWDELWEKLTPEHGVVGMMYTDKWTPIRRLMTPVECRANECFSRLNNVIEAPGYSVGNYDTEFEESIENYRKAEKFIEEIKS